jgi:hypothetical protein
MSSPSRWFRCALGVCGLIALQACVGGGVAYEGGGYGVDYYEPYGYVYGDWGPGYYVGPYRRGWHHDGGHDDHGPGVRPGPRPRPPRPFRPAAPGRAMPSIPSRHR